MTKTFTITNPVPSTYHQPETFEVEIKFMHGDGDAETFSTVKPFTKDETEALSSLIETLNRIASAYPQGRGGDWKKFGFHNIEGFYSWFGEDYVNTEEEYNLEYEHSSVPYETYQRIRNLATPERVTFWHSDITVDTLEADLDTYNVYYYNEEGIKFCVEAS